MLDLLSGQAVLTLGEQDASDVEGTRIGPGMAHEEGVQGADGSVEEGVASQASGSASGGDGLYVGVEQGAGVQSVVSGHASGVGVAGAPVSGSGTGCGGAAVHDADRGDGEGAGWRYASAR